MAKRCFVLVFKDLNVITQLLPNLAYFTTDFYDKLYDDAASLLVNSSPTPISAHLRRRSERVGRDRRRCEKDESADCAQDLDEKDRNHHVEQGVRVRERDVRGAFGLLCASVHLARRLDEREGAGHLSEEQRGGLREALRLSALSHRAQREDARRAVKARLVRIAYIRRLPRAHDQPKRRASVQVGCCKHRDNSSLLIEQVYKLLDLIFPVHLYSINFVRLLEL